MSDIILSNDLNQEQETDKGVFVSDAIIYESCQLGKLNLITAPCGSGKTTAALEKIPEHLQIAQHRSLILINTTAGQDEFVQDGRAYYFNYNGKEWDAEFIPPKDKPTVMTYAMFGAQYKKGNINLQDYDFVVCDELHTLNKYIGMARGKLKKQYPLAAPWEINDMLQMTCFTYIAIEVITQILKEGKIWVFALTATPGQLYKNDLQKLGAMVQEVQYSQKLHAYEIFCKFEYAEIEPILRAIVPENRKRLFYFNTVKELLKYKKILLECGRAAESIWSIKKTDIPMAEENLTTRDFILKEHRFPDGVQDLLINGAYETAISIKDPLVKEAYIHTGNTDTRKQAANRLRQDMEIVGFYNKDKKRDKKKVEKKIKTQDDYVDLIPECYFNIPLYADEKTNLIEEIDFPAKWPSLKKALLRRNLNVIDRSDGKARYSIIQKTPQKINS